MSQIPLQLDILTEIGIRIFSVGIAGSEIIPTEVKNLLPDNDLNTVEETNETVTQLAVITGTTHLPNHHTRNANLM